MRTALGARARAARDHRHHHPRRARGVGARDAIYAKYDNEVAGQQAFDALKAAEDKGALSHTDGSDPAYQPTE